MADWRDRLQPATFRGVPFGVLGSNREGGRRSVIHEFPARDLPFVEDLGRATRRFEFDAFVLGADYLDQRDDLLTALEQPGPGTLVHPYYGTRQVQAASVRVAEAAADAGMARISISFLETAEPEAPEESEDAEAAVEDAAGSIYDQADADLEDGLQVSGVPESAREAAEEEVLGLGELLQGLDVFSKKAAEVSKWASGVQRLITDTASLVLAPVDLVTAVRGAVNGILDAAQNAFDSLYAYQTLFGVEPTLEGGTSPGSVYADANATAVTDAIRRYAVGGAAQAAVSAPWEYREQALDARDSIIGEIDAQMATAGDEAYQDLQQLRAAVLRGVPLPGESLPVLRSVVFPASLPSLVIAYELYDDRDRGDELADRNRARHPGFLPGGAPLEVVVDGG